MTVNFDAWRVPPRNPGAAAEDVARREADCTNPRKISGSALRRLGLRLDGFGQPIGHGEMLDQRGRIERCDLE